MTAPSNFDHGAEEWDNFKSWLKDQHLLGNDQLGLGIDDIGFVAFNGPKHRLKGKPDNLSLNMRDVICVLQDPDDDPQCFIVLTDVCDNSLIQLQIAWSRFHFLPIEESDYCICEDCKKPIPNRDINNYWREAGTRTSLPHVCENCAEKRS